MFFDFGAGELIGLAILGMVLVGPDKLPGLAAQAAKLVKKMRSLATTATNELKENLGPGFEDLKPADLNPKTFVKKQIEAVLDESPAKTKPRKPESKIDPDLL
jgi:sec-independent protein translocase protein TatB